LFSCVQCGFSVEQRIFISNSDWGSSKDVDGCKLISLSASNTKNILLFVGNNKVPSSVTSFKIHPRHHKLAVGY
jgi:hypothetical protein